MADLLAKKDIDGKELLLNTEVQNHHYTSRLGVVKALPAEKKGNRNW